MTINIEEDVYASNTNPDAVWHKHINLPSKLSVRGMEYCCSDINITALVASQNDMIFVYDVWYLWYDGTCSLWTQ